MCFCQPCLGSPFSVSGYPSLNRSHNPAANGRLTTLEFFRTNAVTPNKFGKAQAAALERERGLSVAVAIFPNPNIALWSLQVLVYFHFNCYLSFDKSLIFHSARANFRDPQILLSFAKVTPTFTRSPEPHTRQRQRQQWRGWAYSSVFWTSSDALRRQRSCRYGGPSEGKGCGEGNALGYRPD